MSLLKRVSRNFQDGKGDYKQYQTLSKQQQVAPKLYITSSIRSAETNARILSDMIFQVYFAKRLLDAVCHPGHMRLMQLQS